MQAATKLFRKYTEVVIPDIYYQSRKINVKELDSMFSSTGGIVPAMSYMFTGVSGAGKTTISNIIMSGISSKNSPAVFVSFEMNAEQSKFQFEGKIDMSNIIIVDKLPEKSLEGFERLLKKIASYNPSIVVFDSLQMIVQMVFKTPSSAKGQAEIANSIVRYSKETNIPTIVIGQCTKDGKYAGPSFVKHLLDGHIHANYDPKTGIRSLIVEKNRFKGSINELEVLFQPNGTIKFKSLDSVLNTFSWETIENTFKDIFKKVLIEHLPTILEKGGTIPRIKFNGDPNLPKTDPNYHKGYLWCSSNIHSPLFNKIFVNVENDRHLFNTVEVYEQYKTEFAPYIKRYGKFNEPHEVYVLMFLFILAKTVTTTDKEFLKTLDRMVERFA
jgi:KaiC/GvpD/RAD55 family RecA-like ATPase